MNNFILIKDSIYTYFPRHTTSYALIYISDVHIRIRSPIDRERTGI